MTDKFNRTTSDDLVINELDHSYEVTEQDIDSVSFAACCCTCDIPFVQDAAAVAPDAPPNAQPE
jgi:hypothetical protein